MKKLKRKSQMLPKRMEDAKKAADDAKKKRQDDYKNYIDSISTASHKSQVFTQLAQNSTAPLELKTPSNSMT